MRTWPLFVRDTLRTGAIAAATTPVTAALCAKVEGTSPIGPINAVSHIFWGDKAATRDETSAQYTLAGLAVNSAAVLSWAVVYEAFFGNRGKTGDAMDSMLGGAAVAAAAYVTDYYLVPNRLTPGFEKRLSGRSLFAIYATLALSLGLGGFLKEAE